MEIGSQDLHADEAIFQFEQQRAEAENRKLKEISISESRERNEAERVADTERKQTELLKRQNEGEVLKAEEAKQREQQVAEKSREREVAVEVERVEKARALEAIAREREVELQRIDKEKALELQRKEIAEVIRGRIAVEKTVAEEEEAIKDLRVVADASRTRDATVIAAEAEGEEGKIMQVKGAEAMEEVAKCEARKRLTLATAELEAADKQAAAKIRMAEGEQAEQAASGLAEARVKEADAVATEKLGLANVRVKEANADAIQKEGMAENAVARERYEVTAAGVEQRGLAEVKVKEADASAVAKLGDAEAHAIQARMSGEAAGLTEKAEAMKALDEASREHEEFRIELEKEKEVDLAQITARREIAEAQAKVLGQAFTTAKINIVGGDGRFFDRLLHAVSLGYASDSLIDSSDAAQTLLKEYLDGSRSLPADVKEVLSNPSVDSETLKNLSLSGLLARLLMAASDDERSKLLQLAEKAKELGIEGLDVGSHERG